MRPRAKPVVTALGCNPPLGNPPSLEWVAVGQIEIDPAYQRGLDNETSQSLIRKIARFWDWSLCQPLALTRRTDGSLWAVDGQHRAAAARLRGDIAHLPCVIAHYSSVADEAAAFVALNRQRKPLNAVDLFKAALASGDTQASEIMAAISAAGLSVAPHSNYTAWKPGQIYCVPGVSRAWKYRGPDVVRAALGVLARAFDGQVLQYAGLLLDGLYDVFTAQGAPEDRDALAALIGRRSQRDWVNAARKIQSGGELSRAQSMAKAINDRWRTANPAPGARRS